MLNTFSINRILFFIAVSCSLAAASQSNNKSAFIWFDDVVGQNNLDLNAGVKYVENYITIKGNHHFLLDNNYHQATIEYNKQIYYKIPAKYDLYSDNLIVKIPSKQGRGAIVLDKEKVTAFSIDKQHAFYRFHKQYFEQKYAQKGLFLLKKHYKEKSQVLVKNLIYNKFKLANSYYLLLDKKLILIESKNSWIQLFPAKKKGFKKFYRQQKNLLKKSESDFYIALIQQILQ